MRLSGIVALLHFHTGGRASSGTGFGALVVGLGLAAGASAQDTITLRDGSTIRAKVVKETDSSIWVDLGSTLLELERAEIVERQREEAGEASIGVGDGEDRLYTVESGLAERSPKELAKAFGDAVVKVSTPRGLGSGFIIHPDGYAITNAHVVQGERKIRCTVWERTEHEFKRMLIEDVRIIAVNNHIDLAMIKMEHPDGKPFKTVNIQGGEELAAGQSVFAIGNPLGLERTLSRGVISTTSRSFEGLAYIQTDTQINPGNSGGPLFNDRGEVIGVTNMGIPMGEGLNFAIPARYLKDFIEHRDAFSFDAENPNSGYEYKDGPGRKRAGSPPQLDDETKVDQDG